MKKYNNVSKKHELLNVIRKRGLGKGDINECVQKAMGKNGFKNLHF